MMNTENALDLRWKVLNVAKLYCLHQDLKHNPNDCEVINTYIESTKEKLKGYRLNFSVDAVKHVLGCKRRELKMVEDLLHDIVEEKALEKMRGGDYYYYRQELEMHKANEDQLKLEVSMIKEYLNYLTNNK